MHSRTKHWLLAVVALLAIGLTPVARAAEPDANASPAACGELDTPETGIQGDIPRADQDSGRVDAGYNCGISLLSEVPGGGAVQVAGHCAYVRTGGGINVIDLSDPANPTQVGDPLPTFAPAHGSSSETLRAVVTDERAVMVSGSGVYDIRDCEKPVVKGQIQWPGVVPWPAGKSHDIRISDDGKKVYAGLFVVEADITNLDDPSTWTVQDRSCDVAAQYHPLHAAPAAAGVDLCDHGWEFGPTVSHGPDDSGDGSRLYVGSQVAGSGLWPEEDVLRILDMTGPTPRILDEIPGPGHSIDWFRSADGREYVLHANEIVNAPASSCAPHPRPSSLGWAHEALITEVTGDTLKRTSLVELAINKPENCQAKLASQQNTGVAYHSVDDPNDATFAMVSMGDAALRVFDIRDPEAPKEAAYFNRGAMQHAGVSHFDAARGLILAPGGSGLQVLEVQPQVLEALGLPYPTDPAYPRYSNGRPARPPSGPGSNISAARTTTAEMSSFCAIHQLPPVGSGPATDQAVGVLPAGIPPAPSGLRR